VPEPAILKINEIFWSFQGEGLRVGVPSIFLRLAGCNVRCPYCDSKESWEAVTPPAENMEIQETVLVIDDYAMKYPGSQVVITGGEPMQQDLFLLTQALKKRKFFISIETNGLHNQNIPIDWWTISPKDITGYYINDQLIDKINELKLVVNRNLTYDIIYRIRKKVMKVPIFLQPDGNDEDRYQKTFLLFRNCMEKGLENIRAGIQLHKVYGVR